MSEESYFQSNLNMEPADAGARLLLAEWLAERGDERYAAYEWLAILFKHPYHAYSTWDWWNADSRNPDSIRLPNELWELLPRPVAPGYPRCKEWKTRQEADEAVGPLLRPEEAL